MTGSLSSPLPTIVPGEKEREEPSAGFNTELPTPESEGILSDKRDAYVQEEMRRREREKMRSLQDFAFGMEDEEEEPVMPAAVPDKSSGSAGGSSGAFRTSRAAYADINRQLGSFYEDTAGETGEAREMHDISALAAGEQNILKLVAIRLLCSYMRHSLFFHTFKSFRRTLCFYMLALFHCVTHNRTRDSFLYHGIRIQCPMI